MYKHLPPLNSLKAFECVARLKSFTMAAEELNVTRAAVSHQIKHLEEFLGFKLFERHNRSITLTTTAEISLPKLQQGMQSIGESVKLMIEQGSTKEQVLRVSAAPSFTSKWLVPRLNSFSLKHPEINLDIRTSEDLVDANNRQALAMEDILRSRSVDVIVHFGSGDYPNCRAKKLFSIEAVPLCSPRLLENLDKPLNTPSDLVHHTLLHDTTNYAGRPNWAKWFELAGVNGINTNRGIQFNHVSLAMNAAINGQGVLLSMKTLAEQDIAEGKLCVPFPQSLSLDIAYYVITDPEPTTNSQSVDAFFDWIVSEANSSS